MWISKEKLRRITGNAYDKGLAKGYELGLLMSQRAMGVIFGSDKTKVIKEVENILEKRGEWE